MKPRWKTVAELVVALALTLLGATMTVRGIKGDLLFGVWPSWLLVVGGVLITWVNLDRVHDRWSEL